MELTPEQQQFKEHHDNAYANGVRIMKLANALIDSAEWKKLNGHSPAYNAHEISDILTIIKIATS